MSAHYRHLGTSLEYRTKLVTASGHWEVGLYSEAAEAAGSFRSAAVASRGGRVAESESAVDAARRARGKVRRYCAANRLNRLGTLTYEGQGQHDAAVLRTEVGTFFRRLRQHIGERFPYLWTAEWHKGGHGLHVHFAVGRYVARGWISEAWPHGFVHIKLLGDLPAQSRALGEARAAARYLAKYVGKDLGAAGRGLHRYDVAQGFQPLRTAFRGLTAWDALGRASDAMGSSPVRVWHSSEVREWKGPAAVWAQWG